MTALHFIKCLLLITLSLFLNNVMASEKAVGKVLVTSGALTAQNGLGEKRKLSRGSPVFENDRLLTGNGHAQISFIDGALFTLKPHTHFTVKSYTNEPQHENSVVELVKGGFRTITGSIAKNAPENYRVDTSVASIGVRGTIIRVNFACSDVSSAEICNLEVLKEKQPRSQDVLIMPQHPGTMPILLTDTNPGLSLTFKNGVPISQTETLTQLFATPPASGVRTFLTHADIAALPTLEPSIESTPLLLLPWNQSTGFNTLGSTSIAITSCGGSPSGCSSDFPSSPEFSID